ncbi:MAG: tyrosine recombinase XerD subunit [Planctomycetaceae bacterium]|nr:tyrosine recombinase XerD subunit [Planctomycetaceae bacterium]
MPPRRKPVSSEQTVASPKPNSGEFLAPFLHYLEAECGMAENSRKAYRGDLEQFLAWMETTHPIPLQRVDLVFLGEYLQHLHDRGLKASSIARHLVSLKMFFRYLVLEGVLLESVVELLNSPKLWLHLPHVLSPEMVNRLLAAPSAEDRFPLRDRAFLGLLYATGCRVSEIADLKLRDVHLAENFCRCVGKGNKERLVSLNPVAISALEKYLSQERPELVFKRDTEHLLVSRTGRGLTRVMLWGLVKKYAQRIGASDQVSPHTLRHSFATHMLAGGAEIRALQELLGHASIATTQIYTHVEHSRLKAIHAKCHPRG